MRIDWWTLGLQTVNVAVLVWLLQRFFWRPVAAMIEQRRAKVKGVLDEAEATRAEAAAALAEVDKVRAGFAAERDAILQQAHDAAGQAATAQLADTAARVAALEAAGTAAIAAAQLAGEDAWAERSGHLGVDIAGRLAARLTGPAVEASFLAWLLERLRALPDATRQAAADAGLEAVSAAPINPADQARTTGLIAEALGAAARVTYRTDPALIAGLELHGPHLDVSNSWQADLALISEKVGEGAGHDGRR
jgi:F-type H+-transporting ATPase subunit b